MAFHDQPHPHTHSEPEARVLPIVWIALGAGVVGLYFLVAMLLGSAVR